MVASPSCYARPAPTTDVATIDPAFVARLPADIAGLCQVSNGLIVHELLVDPAEARSVELETRTAADLVAAMAITYDQPLLGAE